MGGQDGESLWDMGAGGQVMCLQYETPTEVRGVNAAADARKAESHVTQKEITRGMQYKQSELF